MNWLNTTDAIHFKHRRIDDVNRVSGARKVRKIAAPNQAARRANKSLKAHLAKITPPFPHAAACRKGDSPLVNVMRHRGNTHFFITDLEGAYGSVSCSRAARIICELDPSVGSNEDIVAALSHACFAPDGGLFQGAPASPALFNLYTGTLLDNVLSPLCERWGITYSRYLDDLTFSASADNPIGDRKRKAIRQIIEQAGFRTAHHKSKVLDLRKGPIAINGIGISPEWRTFVPRKYLTHVKGILHAYRRRNISRRQMVVGKCATIQALTPRRPNQTERKVLTAARELGLLRSRRE